jgi:uncharacterized protein YfaP (DUF2135 family)
MIFILAAAVLYPPVPLETVAAGRWTRPRAELTGTVTMVARESDGDVHFRLQVGDKFVVCEIIPELKVPSPRLNQKVVVRGIVRHDGQHRWWELHPVTSWRPAP